jgi:hypothetical protein
MARLDDRYSIDLSVGVITSPDGPEKPARIQNVSSHGLSLSGLPEPVTEESQVWIEIPRAYGRGRLGFLGRVRWAQDDRAGVAIEAMLPHHRLRLVSLIEELATR